jgi:hypothetical protein
MKYTILFFFCTTAHRSAQACQRAVLQMPPYGHPQHLRCARAALALWVYHFFRVMLVRVPVRGMQGVLEDHQKDLSFSSDGSPKKARRLVRGQGVFVPEGITLPALIGDVPINSKDTTLTVLILS